MSSNKQNNHFKKTKISIQPYKMKNDKTRKTNFDAIFILLSASILLYKIWVIESGYGSMTDCQGCYWKSILKNDSWILSLSIFIYYLSFKRNIINSISLRVLSLSITIIFTLDVLIISKFNTRLFINDIPAYLPEIPDYIASLISMDFIQFIFIFILFSTFTFIAMFCIIPHKASFPFNTHYSTLAAAIFLIPTLAIPANSANNYVHSWVYKNIFDINTTNTLNNHYSKINKHDLIDLHEFGEKQCFSIEEKKKNTLVILIESLSMYHSSYFFGINDWTPKIDKIAKENISYTNFYSNGFTTEAGLISILTGRPPIPKPGQYAQHGNFSFSGFYDLGTTLPNLFKKENYHSFFLTSGNINFLNKGEWLSNLGFDFVEGSESKHYEGMKRYQFNGVPDADFYSRALQLLSNQLSGKPYFGVLETISTHEPYIVPNEDSESIRSEQIAFRYADNSLYDFINELRRLKLIKNMRIFILGDHRAMTPVRSEESLRYGDSAAARVPLIVIDGDKNMQIDSKLQQTDLLNSFRGVLTGKACNDTWTGNLFPFDSPAGAACILYYRGDDRSTLSAFCDNNEHRIKLDGDQTDFIDLKGPRALIHKINWERLGGYKTDNSK